MSKKKLLFAVFTCILMAGDIQAQNNEISYQNPTEFLNTKHLNGLPQKGWSEKQSFQQIAMNTKSASPYATNFTDRET